MSKDVIYNCAKNFSDLYNCSYELVVSFKKKIREITLTFNPKDFYHLVGFQYLTDIAISKDKKKTVDLCLNNKINDDTLKKSIKLTEDIEKRIFEFQFLEDYLDSDNFIRIFLPGENKSWINAEYIIESQIDSKGPTVYIFLKERNKQPGIYCAESFFVKGTKNYYGSNMYWMLKKKIKDGDISILYQHPNYKED